jgi:hypothetical protein
MRMTETSSLVERVHGLPDQAVFALIQLMSLYLDKHTFEEQPMFLPKRKPNHGFWTGEEVIALEEASKGIPDKTLSVLEHPIPSALKNGMRAIGKALYQGTQSTEVMSDVLYRVVKKFPSREQEVIHVLDHAFDGIGDWHA